MQRLEVSGAVRFIYRSLGVKGLKKICPASFRETCQWLKMDRLQNKCTNCKGVKNNTNFGTNYWNTKKAGYNM